MDNTTQLILLLVPIALLQLGLMVIALVDLAKRARTKGPKWAWAVAIVFLGFLGPIAYLVVGRED
ncbi:MAG: PLDc_N domain-containing protein [Anaerolineales bacterium]|nr:MAG: PLDc_N domain-containing protein [Anaerolineales bacterium]